MTVVDGCSTEYRLANTDYMDPRAARCSGIGPHDLNMGLFVARVLVSSGTVHPILFTASGRVLALPPSSIPFDA